jgi:ribonuclease HI
MKVYVDGACSGNPGPGGWGIVFEDGREHSGHGHDTTNNRMELVAVYNAIMLAGTSELTIFTDSRDVVGWLQGWENSRRWKCHNPQLLRLRDEIDRACYAKGMTVTLCWVKGHNGDKWNERANQLAQQAIRRF